MNKQQIQELVEKTTGAIFLNGLVPISLVAMDAVGMDEVDKFWTRFFASEVRFDEQGNLTDESAANILSHMEALSFQCNAMALEILTRVGIMPSAFQKAYLVSDVE